ALLPLRSQGLHQGQAAMRIEIRDAPFDPWAETARYERESLAGPGRHPARRAEVQERPSWLAGLKDEFCPCPVGGRSSRRGGLRDARYGSILPRRDTCEVARG
ncbi:MAG: hypothetical protein ACREXK_11705, partial [Gammaproteobacteria bacterium]